MIFLLLQLTTSCPDIPEPIGVHNAFTQYVQYLPQEVLLPTFYDDEERQLLHGTSLEDALEQKLRSLQREYELLKERTEEIEWCERVWWDEETGLVSFNDWKIVDAMYRSRALEMPSIGHATVPCIDMANHASGAATKAIYETDGQGSAVLQVRDGKKISKGQEVTITYGDEKGASEMIFSYGFLEDIMDTARQMFLDLDIPDDDPLRVAKKVVCKVAPGFRLYDDHDTVGWEGPFVWWSCVNEEDGLDFSVLQGNDGSKELVVLWKGRELQAGQIESLKDVLAQDPMWDVFQLRAMVMLQQRLERQMTMMQEVDSLLEESELQTNVRADIRSLIVKLRELEADLMERAYDHFEAEVCSFSHNSVFNVQAYRIPQKNRLLGAESVQTYLGLQAREGIDPATEEDFS